MGKKCLFAFCAMCWLLSASVVAYFFSIYDDKVKNDAIEYSGDYIKEQNK